MRYIRARDSNFKQVFHFQIVKEELLICATFFPQNFIIDIFVTDGFYECIYYFKSTFHIKLNSVSWIFTGLTIKLLDKSQMFDYQRSLQNEWSIKSNCLMKKAQSEWTGSMKQLMPFWSRRRWSRGPFQQGTWGEVISKAGTHSFNYIFCSVFSSPFSHSTSIFPLYICLYLAAVYGQTFVTLPPCLRLLLSFSVCEAMEIVLFFLIQLSFSFHEFLHLAPKPFFYLCASARATTTALEGVFTDSRPHVRMFSNGHICCADAHNL